MKIIIKMLIWIFQNQQQTLRNSKTSEQEQEVYIGGTMRDYYTNAKRT